MARTKKPNDKKDPNALNVQQQKDQSGEEAVALASLRPSFQATVTLRDYGKTFGDLSLEGLISGLQEQMEATQKGDLGRGKAMLTAQAHTLGAIFNNLARRAINAEYMPNFEAFLKLSLRAQSQCRTTWEAISAIQNPSFAGHVGQANIAHGPQHVNDQTDGRNSTRTEENTKPENELLEKTDVERLDAGTPDASGRTDLDLETVGKVDRAPDE